jgi:hypothetical protein
MAFRYCLLQQVLTAVLFSRKAGFPGRSVIQALKLISRRM